MVYWRRKERKEGEGKEEVRERKKDEVAVEV